ncbi:GNAT family N-acetyltransferase [Salipiger bermudensis]|uniref:GNAT family N-acetyltransferase n=1 Tax=Salipiger bermudensis TaxID=344736 RepID=UPI003515E791
MIDHLLQSDLPQVASPLRGMNALHVQRVPQRFHAEADDAALVGMLAQELDSGAEALVYRAEGVGRGYLLWRRRTVSRSAVERPRSLAVLDHIAVAPSWRRRGIARRLVAGFEAEIAARGCDVWVAHVHSFNGASRGLMQRAGATRAVEVYEKRLR